METNKDFQSKEEFIAFHKEEWQRTGAKLKESRERLELTKTDVATKLNVSTGRIRNLEAGCPVKDSKLLIASYKNLLELRIHEKAFLYNALLLLKEY